MAGADDVIDIRVGRNDFEPPDEPVDCQSADDFFTPPARELISRLCARFLDENNITATELLHSPRHQVALSASPVMKLAIERAESLHERRTGKQQNLVGLVTDGVRKTRARLRDIRVPDFSPENFTSSVQKIFSQESESNAWFIIYAALSNYLSQFENIPEKIQKLIPLIGDETSSLSLTPIDRLLGEYFRGEAFVQSVLGEFPFGHQVDALVALLVGEPLPELVVSPTLEGIHRLLRRVQMPQSLDGLIITIRRELSRPNRLVSIAADDLMGIDALNREAVALSSISMKLKRSSGYLGGQYMETVLHRRMSLLINEDTLKEIVKGKNYITKLRILFLIQKVAVGQSSERAVMEYLRHFLSSRDFASRLLECFREWQEKIAVLADVQRLIMSSRFPDKEKLAFSAQMDEIQGTYLRTQRIFAPLTKEGEVPLDFINETIRLGAANAFTEGKTKDGVIKLIRRHVHKARFVRSFLGSAKDPAERRQKITALQEQLAKMGIPFVDPSALQVLVVDDEDGPRKLVASVLSDMGVGKILTARDGVDAMEQFRPNAENVDLVICDWMMPRMSGIEVLKEVRALRPGLPFLMVTALATVKAVEMAMSEQVTAYIAKPFNPDQIEEKVFAVVAMKSSGQQIETT
ncbi:Response regulator [Azospirillaceae bacterium]